MYIYRHVHTCICEILSCNCTCYGDTGNHSYRQPVLQKTEPKATIPTDKRSESIGGSTGNQTTSNLSPQGIPAGPESALEVPGGSVESPWITKCIVFKGI